jgi:hypothetical protein
VENKRSNYELCYKDLCEKFRQRSPKEIAEKSRAQYDAEKNLFTLKYFNREYLISYPEGSITLKNYNDAQFPNKYNSILDKLFIISYLYRCSNSGLTGKLIPYREIEGVGHTYDFFATYGTNKIAKYFGHNGKLFLMAGRNLNAKKLTMGDISLQFNIFPNIPVAIILWLADEEFEAHANILFDSSASKEIHIADLADLCSKIADELIMSTKEIKNS